MPSLHAQNFSPLYYYAAHANNNTKAQDDSKRQMMMKAYVTMGNCNVIWSWKEQQKSLYLYSASERTTNATANAQHE